MAAYTQKTQPMPPTGGTFQPAPWAAPPSPMPPAGGGQSTGQPPAGWTQGANGAWYNPQGEQMNFAGGTPPWVFDETGSGVGLNQQLNPMPPNGAAPAGQTAEQQVNPMPPAQSPWSSMDVPAGDYDSVREFSDQAYQQARRHLDPMQDAQNRRLDQELINRGVDPRSEMGKEMAAQLARGQNDQNNSAMFSALGFGQGLQGQMYDQMMGRNNMELSRQVQDFNEMMGFDSIDYRNDAFNEGNRRFNMGFMMPFFGMQNPWASGMDNITPDSGGYDDFANIYDDWWKNR